MVMLLQTLKVQTPLGSLLLMTRKIRFISLIILPYNIRYTV